MKEEIINVPQFEEISLKLPYIDGSFKEKTITINKKLIKVKKYLIIKLDKKVFIDVPKIRGKFLSSQKNRAYKNKNYKRLNKLLID